MSPRVMDGARRCALVDQAMCLCSLIAVGKMYIGKDTFHRDSLHAQDSSCDILLQDSKLTSEQI